VRNLALIGLVLIQACATAPPMWTPAARISAATCSAPGAPAASPWQLVTGRGFTFCVPAAWRSSDGRTWRSGGSLVGWCTGRPPAQCPDVRGEINIQVITNPSEVGAARLAEEGDACSGQEFAETISGAAATLSEWHCNGHHVTAGVWPTLAVYLLGQTDDAVTARLQLQVYRTVRFTSGGGR
jgi:hypothetical protein